VAERLTGCPADLSIDLAELGAALLDWADTGVARRVAEGQAADSIVVGSPTFKGSYTGLLKLFLDQFGRVDDEHRRAGHVWRPLEARARPRAFAQAHTRRDRRDLPGVRAFPARLRVRDR
jgi:NADPH-dependent FMN reductase